MESLFTNSTRKKMDMSESDGIRVVRVSRSELPQFEAFARKDAAQSRPNDREAPQAFAAASARRLRLSISFPPTATGFWRWSPADNSLVTSPLSVSTKPTPELPFFT